MTRFRGSPSSSNRAVAAGVPATRPTPPSSDTAAWHPVASAVTSTRTQLPAGRCSHRVRALTGSSQGGSDRLAGRSSCSTARACSWVQIRAPGAAPTFRGSIVSTTERTSSRQLVPADPFAAADADPGGSIERLDRGAPDVLALQRRHDRFLRPGPVRGDDDVPHVLGAADQVGRQRVRRIAAVSTQAARLPTMVGVPVVRTRSASRRSSRPATRTGPATVSSAAAGHRRSPIVASR